MAINNPSSERAVSVIDKVDSKPPVGKWKVSNIFVDPETGRLTVEYDDGVEE